MPVTETEPQRILREAAMKTMREAGFRLRERGWPAELHVDYVTERDTYAVSLQVELPVMPRPVEAP